MKRLSCLKLYILSCIDRGLQTPYDLQRRAGISLGASSQALEQLVSEYLLKRKPNTSTSKRPRHEYTLTTSGKKLARSGWKDILLDPIPPLDLDSQLRLYDMAAANNASSKSVIEFINRVIECRKDAFELSTARSNRKESGELFGYSRLRGEFDKHRLMAEIETWGGIISRLKQRTRTKMVQGQLPL